MPLRLITGGANSGKTGFAFELAIDAVAEGCNPAILVPVHPDVERARFELSRRCPLGVLVSRFDGYVANLWPSRGDGRRIVHPDQRRWILAKCASELGLAPGLPEAAGGVLDRLAGASGERWRSAASAVAASHGDGLSVLLDAYAAELAARGMLEVGEAAYALSTRGNLPHDPIIFHRFTDLTAAQEHLALASADGPQTTVVTLAWEEGRRAFEAVAGLVMRLDAASLRHDHLSAPSHTRTQELCRIESDLFEDPAPAPPAGSVVFSTAEGLEAEVDRVRAEVQRLLTEDQLGPGQIAIVVRGAAPAAARIKHALEEIGILAAVDVAVPLVNTPMGRSIVSLARFVDSGDRDHLLGFLRSGYAWPDPAVPQALEAGWRRLAVEDAGTMIGELPGGWQSGAIRALLAPTTSRVRAAEVWAGLLDKMIETRWGRDGLGHLAESDASVHRACMRVLQDIVDLGDREDDTRSVGSIIAGARVTPARVEQDTHVQIMEASRIQGRRFEAVIIAGLNAGEFPRAGESLLTSPAACRMFRQAGVDIPSAHPSHAERLLFYTAATRAKQHLVLSRRSTDSAGAAVGASIFWEELRDFYRDPIGSVDGDHIDGLDRHSGLAEIGLAEHASATARRTLRQSAISLCEGSGPIEGLPARLAEAKTRSRSAPRRIESEALQAELRQREEFSASELEDYAQCPYKWFTRKIVRPDSDEARLDALSLGSIAHAVLASAYQILREDYGVPRITPSEIGLVPELAERAVAAGLNQVGVPEQQRDRAEAWVRPRAVRSLRGDAGILEGFVPAHTEKSLEHDEHDSVDLGTFRLKGRIDRIDIAEDGRAVVIDYKSGDASRYTLANIKRAGWLQVPLYAAAIGQMLDVEVVGGLYKGLSKGKPRGFFAKERCPSAGLVDQDGAEDIAEVTVTAVLRADEAVAGIRAGAIGPTVNGDHCDYCPAMGYCNGRVG